MANNMVMKEVNILDAKTRLSEYVDRVRDGEIIVICRHNRPVAELRALSAARTEPRPVGPLPDRPTFDLPPSFFEALPADELDLWETGEPAARHASGSPATRPSRAAGSPETYGRPRTRAKGRRARP
jgi:antitoxin (DNA-binding transcriptional repressor) of toxin-antitoxin stability system